MSSPSSYDETRMNRQYALQAARLTLTTMTGITDALQVPFLRVAPQMLNQIITLADTVKSNKDACGQLAKQATDLIDAMAKATVGKSAVHIDESLQEDMEDLRVTLESICDYMIKMNARKMWKRILASSDDGAALFEFRNRLANAVQIFQVRDQISARISQQAVSQDILQKVTNIHDHLIIPQKDESYQISEFLYTPPAYPECFYGRDDFVATAVNLILTNSPAKLAILGPGGVGHLIYKHREANCWNHL
ncbi:hypothetical protein BD410DRAFT_829589 [Rickenella mellea]|uniref:Mixed lineage kinase domain-containing protein n=1 Tax=Rickenella mellea TaxID=50990 RepID=A0A4Y7PZU5_9AGAM|nr:hypothetical protein BD410DRAFT_829589 [Rickenella mellea]